MSLFSRQLDRKQLLENGSYLDSSVYVCKILHLNGYSRNQYKIRNVSIVRSTEMFLKKMASNKSRKF